VLGGVRGVDGEGIAFAVGGLQEEIFEWGRGVDAEGVGRGEGYVLGGGDGEEECEREECGELHFGFLIIRV